MSSENSPTGSTRGYAGRPRFTVDWPSLLERSLATGDTSARPSLIGVTVGYLARCPVVIGVPYQPGPRSRNNLSPVAASVARPRARLASSACVARGDLAVRSKSTSVTSGTSWACRARS